MNLHYYQTNSGKNVIIDYIESLPNMEKSDGYSVLKNLQHGEFDQVQFKRWEKKIYEAYFYKHNRIFYVTINGEDIYLLHACKKQKNKTEKKDKRIVISRAKEVGNMLGQTFI